MRRIFLALAATISFAIMALSADIQSAKAASANYNWSGWYMGLNAGANWGTSQSSTTTFTAPGLFPYFIFVGAAASGPAAVSSVGNQSVNTSGFTGGIQGGYNYQIGNIVLGVEVDFEYFRSAGSTSSSGTYASIGNPPVPFTINSSISTDWLFTARPRLGVAANNWLFYGTGGLAVTKLKANWSYTDSFGVPGTAETASASATKSGWAIGGGVEAAFPGNMSIGVEYLYVKFPGISAISTNLVNSIGGPFPGQVFSHSIDGLASDIVRARVSKKF